MRMKGKYQRNTRSKNSFKIVGLIGFLLLLTVLICFLPWNNNDEKQEDAIIGRWCIDGAYIDNKHYDIDVLAPYRPNIADLSIFFYSDSSAIIEYDGNRSNMTWELIGVEDDYRVYTFDGMIAALDTNPNSTLYNFLSISTDDSDDLLLLTKK